MYIFTKTISENIGYLYNKPKKFSEIDYIMREIENMKGSLDFMLEELIEILGSAQEVNFLLLFS